MVKEGQRQLIGIVQRIYFQLIVFSTVKIIKEALQHRTEEQTDTVCGLFVFNAQQSSVIEPSKKVFSACCWNPCTGWRVRNRHTLPYKAPSPSKCSTIKVHLHLLSEHGRGAVKRSAGEPKALSHQEFSSCSCIDGVLPRHRT